MRPHGEVRQALLQAATKLSEQQGGVTWRDMAEQAQVGYVVARRTVENMASAGALEKIGSSKRAHSRRWMTLYAPRAAEPNFATAGTSAPESTAALGCVLTGWVRR